MIVALDSSSSRPTAQIALSARAAGVSMWNGYIATRIGLGLDQIWTKEDFDNARLCGADPIGYCSGWDDPVAVKRLAALWQVRPCLDVERFIREDGNWVQGWLDLSGAGLYGNLPVFAGRTAAFYVLADYPGFDPQATWLSGPRPGQGPWGWQWEGTHVEQGQVVDRGWFDDAFLAPITMAEAFIREEEVNEEVITGDQPKLDPIPGAAYLRFGVFKIHIGTIPEAVYHLDRLGQVPLPGQTDRVHTWPQEDVDRLLSIESMSGLYESFDPNALTADLKAIKTKLGI